MITILPYSLYTFNIGPGQQFFVAYLNKSVLELFLLLLPSFVLFCHLGLLIFSKFEEHSHGVSALQCNSSVIPRRVNTGTKMRTLNTAV